MKKISQYCVLSDFQPEIIGKVSLAAKSLCMWVRAMEVRAATSKSPAFKTLLKHKYVSIISKMCFIVQ